MFTDDIIDGSRFAAARPSSASECWTLEDQTRHTDSRRQITPLVRKLGMHCGSVHSDTPPEGAANTTNYILGKDHLRVPGLGMCAVLEPALGRTGIHLARPHLGCHLPASGGSPLLVSSFSVSE
jgi:hypothetical protein